MELKGVRLDGNDFSAYTVTDSTLTVDQTDLPTGDFTLEITTTLKPHTNTGLSGMSTRACMC